MNNTRSFRQTYRNAVSPAHSYSDDSCRNLTDDYFFTAAVFSVSSMLSLVRFHHRTKDDIRPCRGPMGNLGDDGGRFIQWLRSIALRPVRVTEACSPPRPSASAAGPSLRTTVVSASVRRESTADDAYIVYSYMYARENWPNA